MIFPLETKRVRHRPSAGSLPAPAEKAGAGPFFASISSKIPRKKPEVFPHFFHASHQLLGFRVYMG
ncbi:MAG: hypothetical protein CW342_08870 [Thermoactinomycetaceae bacterium]|nr:hypothetical protein [Bacillota bacterium]MBO2532986.1 hypothetical protein [Thermoactinomycetaceae bacterium]